MSHHSLYSLSGDSPTFLLNFDMKKPGKAAEKSHVKRMQATVKWLVLPALHQAQAFQPRDSHCEPPCPIFPPKRNTVEAHAPSSKQRALVEELLLPNLPSNLSTAECSTSEAVSANPPKAGRQTVFRHRPVSPLTRSPPVGALAAVPQSALGIMQQK